MRKRRSRRAQAATETILVLSLIIIFLLYIVKVDYGILSTTNGDYTLRKMRFTMDTLIQASDFVYQQGDGAMTQIRLSIPAYVDNITIGNRAINVTLNISGSPTYLYQKFAYDIQGKIPTAQGDYVFSVEAYKNQVNITQVTS